MSFSERLSNADLQTFALTRRELFVKSWAIAVAVAAAKRLPKFVQLPQKYPMPPFKIGDIVADAWIDEFEVEQVETGEVVGICWHPENQRWEYHINWLAGTMPDKYYPCYDGHLTSHTVGCELKLV